MPAHPRLADVVATAERLYPPELAESWDAVGLVCGDPEAEVGRILFAVDPVAAVVDEALAWGADLVVTHHPLFLRPVHGVPATTPKGLLVHRLITRGVALFTAHTNADRAAPGVNDALAAVLGLEDTRPLVPVDDDPALGLGRVGRLAHPEPLAVFARRVAGALPVTAAGIRAMGDPHAVVETVAVCGGAGDSLLSTVRAAGVDVYVTADLRHHPSSESGESGGPALVDVAHWASEWPWLGTAAALLAAELSAAGSTVETRVSATPTDPWTLHQPAHVPGPDEGAHAER
ncbi:Nif3-like dinuclear metal center hexameric protein [Jiangella mangrovi]|uniref:GTP cyclohydrolase 1 type 2 homolog n=1 Tax=Jiangella mangrovi TaxID=1524084 RepID=A0A7W9GX11_9ACTN|nr:dinuclear metal center YbgI/SA1388 family protein [Jiangella mangrovi]